MPWNDDPADVSPMLATTGHAPLVSPTSAYEPKYDGIRAIVSVVPAAGRRTARSNASVRLWSRLGNEKGHEYPEIVEALQAWGRDLKRPLLLDGEIVALDRHGKAVSFLYLQDRMRFGGRRYRRSGPPRVGRPLHRPDERTDVAYVAFDLLRDGSEDLRSLPLRTRRARLERLFRGATRGRLRLGEQVCGDGRRLLARAQANGWEGLVVKRLESVYVSGRRSTDWRKLKLLRTQTCVIGGWTAPRGSRPSFGALLLGVYDDEGRLGYVGSVGSGFSDAEISRVWKRLRALQTSRCPFVVPPRPIEQPSWVKPRLVAEVKFTEWTLDGVLRHPTYLGLRDDVKPERVRREPGPLVSGAQPPTPSPRSRVPSPEPRAPSPQPPVPCPEPRAPSPQPPARGPEPPAPSPEPPVPRLEPRAPSPQVLLDQIDALETSGRDGVLQLPGGERLDVTNLRKVFWPDVRAGRSRGTGKENRLTKGDLFRHYVRVAPYILPILKDRALVMKRYPNGVDGKSFYQHRAPDPLPVGVRVAALRHGSKEEAYLIGGSLVTLLYMVQLATISQDPWFSTVGADEEVDQVAIDLDPSEGVPFARVLDVARWVRDELANLRAPAFAKTSGADGLHVYVPVPPGTPQRAGMLFCQIVATIVASKHPTVATVERSVAARGRKVYVDCLQNAHGKTLASAYSARATSFAGVSTPVTWDEIDEGVSPRDFTIRNFSERLDDVGDLWAGLRRAKGADLRAVTRRGTK